jgi:hypothetical protein
MVSASFKHGMTTAKSGRSPILTDEDITISPYREQRPEVAALESEPGYFRLQHQ